MRGKAMFVGCVGTMLSIGLARAVPVEPGYFGTWAPSLSQCQSDPRIEVSAKSIVIHFSGQVHSYGDLSEDLTCYSGASGTDPRRCVSPLMQKRFPFGLNFNLGGDPNTMQFELLVTKVTPFPLPPGNQTYHRCR
jgi:hypothetical protein